MNSESVYHDFDSDSLIRIRTSSQLMVSAAPDSTSAILLSISAAQAASISDSVFSPGSKSLNFELRVNFI
jgi:hypothetical protein